MNESAFGVYGFEVGDGWEPIIRKALREISKAQTDFLLMGKPLDLHIRQVKEKFGRLVLNIRDKGGLMTRIVAHAEWASECVCEFCGTTVGVETKGGWVKTLCGPCREGWNKR